MQQTILVGLFVLMILIVIDKYCYKESFITLKQAKKYKTYSYKNSGLEYGHISLKNIGNYILEKLTFRNLKHSKKKLKKS